MESINLSELLKEIRVSVVAEACGLTPRAVYKWIATGSLPRTDYTDETDYASKISIASNGRFSAAEIREISKPKQSD